MLCERAAKNNGRKRRQGLIDMNNTNMELISTRDRREDRAFTITSAQIEEFVPLLRMLLKTRCYGSNLRYDERFAVGLTAIAAALQSYDPDRGIKIAWWVAFHIDCSIRNEARNKVRQTFNVVYHPEPFTLAEYVDSKVLCYRDGETELERKERIDLQKKMARLILDEIDRLPERERKIVGEILLAGKTQRDLAKEFGLTSSWIGRVYRSALKHIRFRIVEQYPNADALVYEICNPD